MSGNVILDGNVSTSSNVRDDNNADDAGDGGAMSSSTNAIDISAANSDVSNQIHATATSISNVSANGIISDLSGGSEAMRIIEGSHTYMHIFSYIHTYIHTHMLIYA